ncbi:hypothetical protein FRC01_012361 [Tulasnella sp. 417]|nr:hypothetical protein FRC01_012361 [Tulasnella sp. 417]
MRPFFRASIVALITSTVNITVLTSMHGKQLGWVCLASCGADVTINAMVIAWVSGGQEQRFQRCQHNCSGSIPAQATPDSLGPQSPLPKAGSKWRGRNDDINWLDGPGKFSAQGEWSPSAKFEFDFGRRGSGAGLLAPGSGDSVLGPLQEPKTPPLAVPRSGLPFSLPKVTEHSASDNIAVDITSTAPGHQVIHVPIPSPRFSRQNQLARSASHLSEAGPPSSRTISLPEQPDATPGAGPSSAARRHSSRKRSIPKYGQETVFTQRNSQLQSGGTTSPRRSTVEEAHGVRGTFMRGLGSMLGLNRSSTASDAHRSRLSRRGRSRETNDWTASAQEKMTQVTAVTDISTIVFRHGDSQFETSTIDSSDTEDYCDPSPCSHRGSLQPWAEESHQSVKGVDDRPGSSGEDTERGCSTPKERPPMSNDSERPSSEVPPPYQVNPDTQEKRDS